MGKCYQAFPSPLLALSTPAAVGLVLRGARGEQDQKLWLGWKYTFPVSFSSSAELSGDRNKTTTGTSGFHFPWVKPSLVGLDGAER